MEQLREIHGPWLSGDLPPAFEYGGRRDAADLVSLTQAWVFVCIDLGESHLRLELRGRLLEKRGHHLAGGAPGSPKVHDKRKLTAGQMPIEGLIGQRDGVTGEQWLLALAAARVVTEPGGRDAVRGLTIGANKDLRGSRHLGESKSAPAPSLGYHPRFAGTPKSRRVASSTGLRWHLAPWAMRSIDFTGWH